MVDFAQLNPLQSLGIGSIGWALLIFAVAVLICIAIGGSIWWFIYWRSLKYLIPLQKKVGNTTMKVATYKAKDFKIGLAGDKLWHVPKAKKYIPPATIQTAPNEYTHYEREDGEWINISYPDVDEEMKKLKVKYVHQDMRANRIAISEILEQRFKSKKSFWEQYGGLISLIIFYMIVCIFMVIIFYQWTGIVDKTDKLFAKIVAYEDLKRPQDNLKPVASAILFLIFRRFKR